VAKAHDRLAQGYARLQVKVGDDPLADATRVLAVRDAVGPDIVIYADANCGFTLSSARTFVRALGADGAGIYLEQPCATLGECAALRESWAGPMVMDENIVSLTALLEAHRLGVADGVTIKLTRVGGITPASLMRSVAVELGIHVTVEDASGGDLVTAAFAHMNGSTPAKYRVHSCDFGEWVTLSCINEPRAREGNMLAPSERPGLGVTLNHDTLGTPFLDLSVSPAQVGR
jgi:cis-L-3-hydroxyproline dehydratase